LQLQTQSSNDDNILFNNDHQREPELTPAAGPRIRSLLTKPPDLPTRNRRIAQPNTPPQGQAHNQDPCTGPSPHTFRLTYRTSDPIPRAAHVNQPTNPPTQTTTPRCQRKNDETGQNRCSPKDKSDLRSIVRTTASVEVANDRVERESARHKSEPRTRRTPQPPTRLCPSSMPNTIISQKNEWVRRGRAPCSRRVVVVGWMDAWVLRLVTKIPVRAGFLVCICICICISA
jgi:hypothetical protein